MIRFALALAFTLALAANAFATTGPEHLSNPQQEARAVALEKQLRCLQCQGESIDESNAPIAADLRRLIRARIAAGQSDAQIEAYLVSRYGDFILMQPPLKAATWGLWFGPALILLLGSVVVVFAISRARRA